jgi:hypothetical protein
MNPRMWGDIVYPKNYHEEQRRERNEKRSNIINNVKYENNLKKIESNEFTKNYHSLVKKEIALNFENYKCSLADENIQYLENMVERVLKEDLLMEYVEENSLEQSVKPLLLKHIHEISIDDILSSEFMNSLVEKIKQEF